MIGVSSFASCFKCNVRLDLDKFQMYLIEQEAESEDDDGDNPDDDKPSKKRPFRNRNHEAYDPADALSSEWYRRYVSDRRGRKDEIHLKSFVHKDRPEI